MAVNISGATEPYQNLQGVICPHCGGLGYVDGGVTDGANMEMTGETK